MNKDISDLIISIKRNMKEYADGNLSFNEAKDQYLILVDRYGKIEKELKRTEGMNIAGSLFYHHNIENYCLVSGLYKVTEENITSVVHYGDPMLNAKTTQIIKKNFAHIHTRDITGILPNGDDILHNIYIYPITATEDNKLVFACVTSSTYFTKDKLKLTGNLLTELISARNMNLTNFDFNYYNILHKSIEQYIKDNTNQEFTVLAHIFVFLTVERIFSHMGTKSLLKLADEVKKNIEDTFAGSQCLTLSIRNYIALERVSRDINVKYKKKRLEVHWQDLNLPFKTASVYIDSEKSIPYLWEKVAEFEQEVSS